jgi:hypothetical protein
MPSGAMRPRLRSMCIMMVIISLSSLSVAPRCPIRCHDSNAMSRSCLPRWVLPWFRAKLTAMARPPRDGAPGSRTLITGDRDTASEKSTPCRCGRAIGWADKKGPEGLCLKACSRGRAERYPGGSREGSRGWRMEMVDRYTKAILTVIALALVALVGQNALQQAKADREPAVALRTAPVMSATTTPGGIR